MISPTDLADAVVAERGSAALIRPALDDGIGALAEALPALVALFDSIEREPDWLDHDRCDRAADALGAALPGHDDRAGDGLAAARRGQ